MTTNYINKILKEMCNIVHANPKKIDFKKEDWFYKHEWTEAQQDKFKSWLIKLLKTNGDARRQLMAHPSLHSDKDLEKFANMFIFNYGWKTKENKK
jgi:hypothetical protein